MGKQRKTKNIDLTVGNITSSLWKFAVPLMLGNVLQQLYNLVDTWVVGHYIGDNALAAVGSSYTLMTFLTSIVIGLCLGSSAFLSMAYGKKNQDLIRNGIFISAVMIGSLAVILTGIIYIWMNPMIRLLQVPQETTAAMREYLFYVFIGFFATFLYNYVANVLRGIGNSVTPLFFLGISVILNIFLDLYFVLVLHMGIKGAAVATVIAQYVSGVGILLYFLVRYPEYHISRKDMKWNRENLKQIMSLSGFTCLQQSVMNFGILVVQGIVNSFGATVMAAFAVAVKIDTIAYMPVGDFGNAFSVFVAQNYGAGKKERIRQGIRQSVISVILFCIVISCGVFVLAQPLMQLFVSETSREIIAVGVQYLRIEGACYVGIGILFMLYGYYRAVNRPNMSVVLTVISLGTRVLLSYTLSKISWLGVTGIWVSIPIGWFFADAVGILVYLRSRSGQRGLSPPVRRFGEEPAGAERGGSGAQRFPRCGSKLLRGADGVAVRARGGLLVAHTAAVRCVAGAVHLHGGCRL